jgi:glutamate dehydrogenase/leucine dehydrogenase
MDGCDALLQDLEHEHVEIVREPRAGLLAIVAVHSTALGPAMGGMRRTGYVSLSDAIEDALRLSAAMTVKSSLAGLPLGGGKSVIVDPSPRPSEAMLDAFAEQLERLGGRYVAAEDIGTSPADMDRLAQRTRWVAGGSPERGGSGDPSPSTARTVLGAIEHAVRLLDGDRGLEGLAAGVLGVGKVGAELALMLAARGAEITVADVDAERAQGVAAATGGSTCAPRELLGRRFDVLAPCARGGVVTEASIGSLRTRILCGAANNLLADDALAGELAQAGVLYVPDFLANAGGIIHAGGELLGFSEEQTEETIQRSIALGGSILAEAASSGELPLDVATRRALARVRAAAEARDAEPRGDGRAPGVATALGEAA